uniref:HNH endonuclease n=1 Tax=Salmonella phage vB_STmST313_KE31 TaxID=3161181 RepID=A0AAU8GIT2_9CAUD
MLTQQSLKEILYYDEDTGWFTWLIDRGGTAKSGSRAGSLRPDGYRVIRIGEKKYLEHRLAFLYKTGSWPKKLIDHKNRIRDDNRWLNLRESDKSQNAVNTDLYSHNTTGARGVFRYKDRWCVQIRVDGKYRSFGHYVEFEEAKEMADKAYKELFGEFYQG